MYIQHGIIVPYIWYSIKVIVGPYYETIISLVLAGNLMFCFVCINIFFMGAFFINLNFNNSGNNRWIIILKFNSEWWMFAILNYLLPYIIDRYINWFSVYYLLHFVSLLLNESFHEYNFIRFLRHLVLFFLLASNTVFFLTAGLIWIL